MLSKIEIPESFKEWAIKYLYELEENETKGESVVSQAIQDAYNACLKRIDNLTALKISPNNSDGSLLSDEEFKRQKEALLREKLELEGKINGSTNEKKVTELSQKTFNFARYARYWFAHGTREERRQILFGLGSNLNLINKQLGINLQKPYLFIKEAKEEVANPAEMFEPENLRCTEAQTGLCDAPNPSWLPGEDSDL